MRWYDENWLIAAITFAGVIIFFRQLRSMAKGNDFAALGETRRRFHERFSRVDGGGGRFYGLRERYAQYIPSDRASRWGPEAYRLGIHERLELVAGLADDERAADLEIVEPWVNALNDVAELIDLDFVRPAVVLSKYHLAVAREVYLAEPYIYYVALFTKRGRWGLRVLRLGEMAREYNDRNPVHRAPIGFLDDTADDTDAVAIYPAPTGWGFSIRRPYWAVTRRLTGYPTITERAKRRQNREISRLSKELAEDSEREAGLK